MQKRLIEHNIPLAEISEESAREKNIRHGHPSTLHIWWARRPLAASRATAFAALIDDPGPDEPAPDGSGFKTKRQYLEDLIKRITPWEAIKNGNSKDITEAQEVLLNQWKVRPKVIDPFAGGGSIPLETSRLGCHTYAFDYNPVAVFIERATIEWPRKFGVPINDSKVIKKNENVTQQLSFASSNKNLLSHLIEKWATIINLDTYKKLAKYYPNEEDGSSVIAYIWARQATCQNPSCQAKIPLIKQFWLAQKKNRKIALKPVINSFNKKITFEIVEAKKSFINFDPSEGFVSNADAKCPFCGQITKGKIIRQQAQLKNLDDKLVAIVSNRINKPGKNYRIATINDEIVYQRAKDRLNESISEWPY